MNSRSESTGKSPQGLESVRKAIHGPGLRFELWYNIGITCGRRTPRTIMSAALPTEISRNPENQKNSVSEAGAKKKFSKNSLRLRMQEVNYGFRKSISGRRMDLEILCYEDDFNASIRKAKDVTLHHPGDRVCRNAETGESPPRPGK